MGLALSIAQKFEHPYPDRLDIVIIAYMHIYRFTKVTQNLSVSFKFQNA